MAAPWAAEIAALVLHLTYQSQAQQQLRTTARQLQRHADAAAWTGVEEVVRGGNTGTAAPTSGTWAQGRIVWNSAPSASGFIGWVCVTAGTPGTWKTFGAISS